MRIKKVSSDTIKLYETSQVKFKIAEEHQRIESKFNSLEVQFTAGNNNHCPIQNISKKALSRYQTPKSVRKSINRLMDLIRCNATEPSYCKWITLTYADVMTDHTKVYEDGKMFIRRLQRYLNKSEEIADSQKSFKRITVAELQGESHDNSWYLHLWGTVIRQP